jgi:hypothetical protein
MLTFEFIEEILFLTCRLRVPFCSLPFQGRHLQSVSGLLKPIDQRSAGTVPPLVNAGSTPGADQ